MLSRFFKKEDKSSLGSSASDEGFPEAAGIIAPGEKAPQLNWLPGDVIDNRYRIDRIFGGAMGKVYIAEHLGWGVWMAIKSPRPEVWADREGLQRILREAAGWIRLGVHPNIASCYYVRAISRIPHIFIEYAAGGTLEDWINRGRCKDMRTALSLAVQFCNGMEYTHFKGFIHRDIKPQNILLTKDGLVKITDFGILRLIGDSPEESDDGTEKPGQDDTTVGFRGTPNYASPEQLRDTHRVDRRTDIFSFGLCLWMMFCGKRPYKDNRHKQSPAPVATSDGGDLPKGLQEILAKSVAWDADERFNDFSELKDALNGVYLDLFHVACPYAIMEKIDMRAENLNNRAVSVAELGKFQQAANYLSRTLEINDNLPEALYNLFALRWHKTNEPADRLLRQIDGSKKRFPKLSIFDGLEKEITDYIDREGDERRKKRNRYPELQLCFPRAPMEIFREAQLRRSVQNNILHLLQNRQLTECFDTLRVSWGSQAFKKDKFYNRIYEQLLPEGIKRSPIALQRIVSHPGIGQSAAFLASIPERNLAFSASAGTKVYVYSLGQRKNGVLLTETMGGVTALAANAGTGLLVMGQKNGSVVAYQFKVGSQKVLSCGKGVVQAVCFSRNESGLFVGMADGKVVYYDLASGETKMNDASEGGGVCCLASLDGYDFVVGCEDGSLRFYNGQTGECRAVNEGHVHPVTAISVSPDRKMLATGSADRHVRIWDCSTHDCLQNFDGHEDAVTSVLLLADGQTVVVGCHDDIIKIWNVQSGKCSHILDARGDGVCSLAPGEKPHTFLAGHQDGTIVLWSIIYQLEFDDGRPSALRDF